MIITGNAWAYKKYVIDSAFTIEEQKARVARVGVWTAKRQTAPWIWRKNHNVGEIYNG